MWWWWGVESRNLIERQREVKAILSFFFSLYNGYGAIVTISTLLHFENSHLVVFQNVQ